MARYENGMTLVELMVAMTIGLFITGGVISLFVGNNQAFRSSEAVAVVQENGRYAIEYLAQELRQSGVIGCQRTLHLQHTPAGNPVVGDQARLTDLSLAIKNLLNIGPTYNECGYSYSANIMDWLLNYNAQPQIEGFDGNGIGSGFTTTSQNSALVSEIVASNILIEAIEDHDVIVTRRAVGRAIPIKKHEKSEDDFIVFGENAPYTNASGSSVTVNRAGLLKENDIVIASTCYSASIFQVTEKEGNANENIIKHEQKKPKQCPGNADIDLRNTFANPNLTNEVRTPEDSIGALYRLATTIFYIRKNDEGVPTLYSKTNLSDAEQIIPGIYGMQVLYGTNANAESCDSVGNNPGISTYAPASNIANWNEVNAVRIWLLAGSPEANHGNVVDKPMKLPFPAKNSGGTDQFNAGTTSTTIGAGDQRRFFQVFKTTIYLRNKLPCIGWDKWTAPASP